MGWHLLRFGEDVSMGAIRGAGCIETGHFCTVFPVTAETFEHMRRGWCHWVWFNGYGEYGGKKDGHYECDHRSVSTSGLELTDSIQSALPRVTLAGCIDKGSGGFICQ